MGTMRQPGTENTYDGKLPMKAGQREFNRYIKPFLSKGSRGPKLKVSYYKIFNYILSVLHTGIRWRQIRTYGNELHWSNVYRHHNRWSKDKSYERLFRHSLSVLRDIGNLDLSILQCGGPNAAAETGAIEPAIQDANTGTAGEKYPLLLMPLSSRADDGVTGQLRRPAGKRAIRPLPERLHRRHPRQERQV